MSQTIIIVSITSHYKIVIVTVADNQDELDGLYLFLIINIIYSIKVDETLTQIVKVFLIY